MDNIFLIGFMGTGKSTIAKGLSAAYHLKVVEMDELIEKRQGMSISDIFAKKGEEYFRKLETELLKEIQHEKNVVVSCGGGTPLRSENVNAMKENGKVVLLNATPESIFERVKNNHNRPLLENNKNVDYIKDMLAGRKDKYFAAADIIIETDNKSREQICTEIGESLGLI
ncbi:MAG: shikimate kinase [Pseudobutyrivibrio sp.]|nr:shikimate kinase [Pseudobutyrivibrio sp.]